MSIYVGVDPGMHGAIAFYDPNSDRLVMHDMPIVTERKRGRNRSSLDAPTLVALLQANVGAIRSACIEDVHSMPNQGIATAFSFGFNTGVLHGVFRAFGIPVHLVAPVVWKGMFKLGRDKAQSRRVASEKFPQYADLWRQAQHDGRAEAALIAAYGWLQSP